MKIYIYFMINRLNSFSSLRVLKRLHHTSLFPAPNIGAPPPPDTIHLMTIVRNLQRFQTHGSLLTLFKMYYATQYKRHEHKKNAMCTERL
jgi:hypothetical protein